MLGDARVTEPLKVFGKDLTHLPLAHQFAVLASGNLICSLGFAFLQEKVFTIPGFEYGGFMTFLTTLTFAGLGMLERVITGDLVRKASLKDYMLLSVFTMGGMYFTNWSLVYLNYPSRIMFKSSKVIPVMLMGVLIQRRAYSFMEYISAGVLVIGIILFVLGDASESPRFDVRGVILITIGVVLDAITSNFEEKRFFRATDCTQAELMFYSSAIGSVWAFVSLVQTGELFPALEHASENPNVVIWTVSFATLGYLSVIFVLLTIKRFGATNAEIVKSLRKVLSIIISYIFIAKPFGYMHVLGGMFFFGSIYLSVMVKQRKVKSSPAVPEEKPMLKA